MGVSYCHLQGEMGGGLQALDQVSASPTQGMGEHREMQRPHGMCRWEIWELSLATGGCHLTSGGREALNGAPAKWQAH